MFFQLLPLVVAKWFDSFSILILCLLFQEKKFACFFFSSYFQYLDGGSVLFCHHASAGDENSYEYRQSQQAQQTRHPRKRTVAAQPVCKRARALTSAFGTVVATRAWAWQQGGAAAAGDGKRWVGGAATARAQAGRHGEP